MNAPFAAEMSRRLQLLFNNPPAVTSMEIAVVSATVAFLMLVPTLFGLGEARRRRAASQHTFEPLPAPLALDLVPPTIPEAATEWGGDVASAATAELPDAASTGTIPPPAGDTEFFAHSASLSIPREPVAVVETVSVAASLPKPAFEQTPSVADSVGVAWAVRRGPFAAPAIAVGAAHGFEVLDLRQARLTDWPPSPVHLDPEQSRLWHEGEQLAARYDARISKLPLRAPQQPESTALARVESDGVRHRLHFFLFTELWPSSSADAVGRAVFEIDPVTDAVEGWVEI